MFTYTSLLPGSQNSKIIGGVFDYNEAFAAFLRGTTQKKDAARVIKTLYTKLNKFLSPSVNQPMTVLDIGCANAMTGLQYLNTIHHSEGFNYYGIDPNSIFIKEAEAILAESPIIKQKHLITGDALSGNLKGKNELSSVLFDLIFVSHAAYYINDTPHDYEAFIKDITQLLLPNGIAILLHAFLEIRKKHGTVGTVNTPTLLSEAYLSVNGIQLKNIEITSSLKFLDLSDEMWEALKCPEHYHLQNNNFNFIDTVYKLSFIVHSSLNDMHEKGNLKNYIDEIKTILRENNNCFNIKTQLQIVVSAHCSFQSKVNAVLEEFSQELKTTPVSSAEALT